MMSKSSDRRKIKLTLLILVGIGVIIGIIHHNPLAIMKLKAYFSNKHLKGVEKLSSL